jgi:hypothetical protein
MYVNIRDYSLFQSVYSIKTDLISKNKKLNNKSFYLKYKTHILEDNKTLYEYKIKKEDQLEIVFKSKGGTMARGLSIFIWVMVFIFYFLFLATGLIPFIAFIIPNVLIKGLSTIVNYFYELTYPNNFMNSFLYFVKTYLIPFMNFIFQYFGLYIFTYILTFFSLYHIYYYAKKENVCTAYNTTKVVSMLTSIIIVIFYFIANLGSLFKVLSSFIPKVIRQPFVNLANKISGLRLTFIGFVPYIGPPQSSLINMLSVLFKGIGYLKLFGNQLLENWNVAMELIKSDEVRQITQEQGIDEIINYIRTIEKAEEHYANGKPITNKNKKNAEGMETIIPGTSPAANIYFLRSAFFNIIKMIIDMTFFIDICKVNGDYESIMQNMKEEFMKMVELEKKENLTEDKRKEKIQEFVEKIKSIKLDNIINIDCIINTMINGATFSFIVIFFFLIIFILFFFVKL